MGTQEVWPLKSFHVSALLGGDTGTFTFTWHGGGGGGGGGGYVQVFNKIHS